MDNSISNFEIRDNEIDVEEIMKKIRENIKLREKSGVYPPQSEHSSIFAENCMEEKEQNTNMRVLDLVSLSSRYDIQHKNYSISSHHSFIGKFLTRGRKLVHDEVCRYVNPVIWKQIEFNKSILKAFTQIDKLLNSFNTEIQQRETYIKNQLWLSKLLDEKKDKISRQESVLIGQNIQESPLNYFLFSDEVNNVPPETYEIFKDSLPYFKNCKNVIDIGCGRGSLLKNLQSHDIGCYGIDSDENNILFCKKYDLNVYLSDALDHLRELDDKSLDGVFIGQVLEHMTVDNIFTLIKLIYTKMQYGSYVIIVVPNILSVIVATNYFHQDPTHITQLHPIVVKFILKSFGFREIHDKYYQPVNDDVKLDYVKISDDTESGIYDELISKINSNTEKLNNLLFGDMDYCVIARK